MLALGLGREKKREDPCACAEVEACFVFFDSCVSAQKNGVHSEAESVRVLNAIKPAKLQVIRALAGL